MYETPLWSVTSMSLNNDSDFKKCYRDHSRFSSIIPMRIWCHSQFDGCINGLPVLSAPPAQGNSPIWATIANTFTNHVGAVTVYYMSQYSIYTVAAPSWLVNVLSLFKSTSREPDKLNIVGRVWRCMDWKSEWIRRLIWVNRFSFSTYFKDQMLATIVTCIACSKH